MHCAYMKRPCFHFDLKSDAWPSFSRPRFRLRRGNMTLINKGYIAFFIAHAQNGLISTSGLKYDVTGVFLDPKFPKKRENFGDSRTFEVDIELFNICMGFRTSWPKIFLGRSKTGERMLVSFFPTQCSTWRNAYWPMTFSTYSTTSYWIVWLRTTISEPMLNCDWQYLLAESQSMFSATSL